VIKPQKSQNRISKGIVYPSENKTGGRKSVVPIIKRLFKFGLKK
jgi:hypothetical protein